LINNQQSSLLMKKVFNLKYIAYENIELSDNSSEDTHRKEVEDTVYMYCLYDRTHKRWKPYKLCKQSNKLFDRNQVNKMETKISRI